MELQELLKHVSNYYEIYEILWDGPVTFDDIKKYLMIDCHKPESTARSYITAIRNGNNGMLFVDEEEGTMELDTEAVKQFEQELQELFNWNLYDQRHEELENYHKKLDRADEKIVDLEMQITMLQRENKSDRETMQKKLNQKDAELKHYKEKDLMVRCKERIFSLNTVQLSSDNLKDLAYASDGMIKLLHRHWNPFRRIKSEFEMRKSFAEELLSGDWCMTAEVDGKKHKCNLVPMDEFGKLYNELKSHVESYEREHR